MAGDVMGPGDLLARRYRLVARTGEGGMSAVWRAVDERLARPVAVKLPAPQCHPDHADRLRQEARACARIDHPAAVEVFDFGEAITPQGRIVPFTVMPLLSGEPLAARVAAGPLPWREAVQAAARVAGVLAAAHEQGIVHQDVSAENVHLTRHGAVLLDFGLAAGAGVPDGAARSRGTPPYVAPERLAGAPPDPASDMYAWGVVLFEALTGRRPFPGSTWEEIDQVRRDDPPPLGVRGLPAAVAALCQRSLAATPAERPSAREAEQVLGRAAVATPPGRRLGVAVGVVAALVAGGVTATLLTNGSPPGYGEGAGKAAASAPASGPAPAEGIPAGRAPGRSRVPVEGGRALRPSAAPEAAAPSAGDPPPAWSPAPVPQLREALDRFQGSLTDGQRSGAIRKDVSTDLGQLAERLAWAAATGADTDLTGLVWELRRKVDDRVREGAITSQVADGLHADLATVADAAEGGARD